MAKTSELFSGSGQAGIVTALPTCRPVAFNCSLSVAGVLRKVVVSPVTSRLAPQHLGSVVTWRTLHFLFPVPGPRVCSPQGLESTYLPLSSPPGRRWVRGQEEL